MKLKSLLFVGALLLSLNVFSQAEAYPVTDIQQCNDEIFDLTVNTPVALGNQDPLMYSVAYFETEEDAQNNANQIQDPMQYIPVVPWSATIYLRVSNNSTNDFDITSFQIVSYSIYNYMEDVLVCGDVYIIPANLGNIYTGPGGTGTLLPAGTVISSSTILYVYNQMGPCTQDTFYNVTISEAVVAQEPTPLYVCDDNNDGYFQMNLGSKTEEITNGVANLEVTYHTSYNAALAGAPQINQQTFTIQGLLPYIVYARVENPDTGCYQIVELKVLETTCTDNVVSGTVMYDTNNNGCTNIDVLASGVEIELTSGSYTAVTFTSANGHYLFSNVPDGPATVAIAPGSNFTGTPATSTVSVPGNGAGNNFCLVATTQVNDLAVTIVPITNAQSGFPAAYTLVVENNGTLPTNCTVTLQYDNTKLVYNSSNPGMNVNGNILSITYSNLQPFQNAYINVYFTVMTPQIVPAGDILLFTASVSPVTGDVTPDDNVDIHEQIVVNAYDPNDITVHEGEFITPDKTDEYLHYTIRFQNEGNANAVNIRVDATTDANLDWNTFEPVASSHNYSTALTNEGLSFLFNNINLTWAGNNEPDSHGYITYRVKPQGTVGLGDTMQGSAGIFFDFNDPVMTNVATTTVQNTMGISDIVSESFVMYPNPAKNIVTIQLANTHLNAADVVVTDVTGKTVIGKNLTFSGNAAELNVSGLSSGIYFVQLTSEGQSATRKLIIK